MLDSINGMDNQFADEEILKCMREAHNRSTNGCVNARVGEACHIMMSLEPDPIRRVGFFVKYCLEDHGFIFTSPGLESFGVKKRSLTCIISRQERREAEGYEPAD